MDDDIPLFAYQIPYRYNYGSRFMFVDPKNGRCTVLEKYGKLKVCAHGADCGSCNIPILAAMGQFGPEKPKNARKNLKPFKM